MKKKLNELTIILAVALGVILVINLFLISGLNSRTEKKIEEIKELRRPVKLELIVIKDKNCKDCFDITPFIDSIKKANTEIVREEQKDVSEAKDLIKKYSIERLPTIILSGEIDRIELGDFEEKEGILLFKEQKPVYVDAASGNAVGRVSLVHIKDSSCDKCTGLENGILGLEQSGVVITSKKTVERSSDEGRELIKKYKIGKIPAIIFSDDLSAYGFIADAWDEIGTIEKDGSYVTRDVSAPFINASTGRIVGLVDLTMLTDKNCEECYDVNIHKNILKQFGVALNNEKAADITDEEGKKLIEKYGIKAVPTIILSKDASNYPALVQVWSQVGSVEGDGNFVFREIKAISGSVYRDLTTNKIVK